MYIIRCPKSNCACESFPISVTRRIKVNKAENPKDKTRDRIRKGKFITEMQIQIERERERERERYSERIEWQRRIPWERELERDERTGKWSNGREKRWRGETSRE